MKTIGLAASIVTLLVLLFEGTFRPLLFAIALRGTGYHAKQVVSC
jgi:hypothetical protein